MGNHVTANTMAQGEVAGNYYLPGRSERRSVQVKWGRAEWGAAGLAVIEQPAAFDNDANPQQPEPEPLRVAASDGYRFGDVIPGLPVDLHFLDGGRFVPTDANFRWPQLSRQQRLPAWLEGHWLMVAVSILLVPAFLWLMITKVIPAASHASVYLLPDSVAQSLGEQTLYILDKVQLDNSQRPLAKQRQVREQWQSLLKTLSLNNEHYRLHFRSSDMGANALALPDGSVIVTDALLELMEDTPDSLSAVLLHEIGHVEHKHGLKLLAQSTVTSLLFTFVLGDVEGAGELIIGASAGLLQNAFSRDMEREADHYAHTKLKQLGLSPALFGEAIGQLMASHGETADADDSNNGGMGRWLKYLSSHPDSQVRIDAARSAD